MPSWHHRKRLAGSPREPFCFKWLGSTTAITRLNRELQHGSRSTRDPCSVTSPLGRFLRDSWDSGPHLSGAVRVPRVASPRKLPRYWVNTAILASPVHRAAGARQLKRAAIRFLAVDWESGPPVNAGRGVQGFPSIPGQSAEHHTAGKAPRANRTEPRSNHQASQEAADG